MKPTVKYVIATVLPTVGRSAWIYALDHPNFLGTRLLHTSKVLSVDEETGNFETLNTLYVRVDDYV